MNRIMRDVNDNDLKRPNEFIPEWFKLSHSIADTYSSCREKIVWQYVFGIRPKKQGFKLLRRNAIIFGSRKDISSMYSIPESEAIDYFLRKEATEDPDYSDDIEKSIKRMWEFPPPENKWSYITWENFRKQCISGAKAIRDAISDGKLIELYDEENLPMVQRNLLGKLVTTDGEVLDTTFDQPTKFRAQINFVDINQSIWIWKISDKATSANQFETFIKSSTAPLHQLIAVYHHLKGNINFPVKILMCKIVLNKSGLVSNFEVHEQYITKEMMNNEIRILAIKSKDIKNMNLFKEPSFSCSTFCDYRDICLANKRDNYMKEIVAGEIEYDDSDDSPF